MVSSIVNFSITNLNAPVALLDVISSDTVRKDTAYFSYCNKKTYGNLYKQKNSPPSLSINTIYHKVFYIEGLGGPYMNYDYTNPFSNYNSDVIYYKKGAATCGTLNIPVGLQEEKLNNINLEFYPNPTAEFLFIKTNSQLQDLFLTDLMNKKIKLNYQSGQNYIDLKYLAPGVYYLTAVFSNKIITKKIIKY